MFINYKHELRHLKRWRLTDLNVLAHIFPAYN